MREFNVLLIDRHCLRFCHCDTVCVCQKSPFLWSIIFHSFQLGTWGRLTLLARENRSCTSIGHAVVRTRNSLQQSKDYFRDCGQQWSRHDLIPQIEFAGIPRCRLHKRYPKNGDLENSSGTTNFSGTVTLSNSSHAPGGNKRVCECHACTSNCQKGMDDYSSSRPRELSGQLPPLLFRLFQ